MTTIAFKDGMMVADTQITCDGFIIPSLKYNKLSENERYIWGFSGQMKYFDDVEKFVTLHENKTDKKIAKLIKKCQNRHIKKHLKILMYDKSNLTCFASEDFKPFVPVKGSFTAIGSGAEIASALMEVGVSVIDAVRITSKYDIYTNDILQIKGDVEKVK